MENKIIAVDFDGTLCENRYPEIGKPNEKVINYLIKRQKEGDKLILWTCRCGCYYSYYCCYLFCLSLFLKNCC